MSQTFVADELRLYCTFSTDIEGSGDGFNVIVWREREREDVYDVNSRFDVGVLTSVEIRDLVEYELFGLDHERRRRNHRLRTLVRNAARGELYVAAHARTGLDTLTEIVTDDV